MILRIGPSNFRMFTTSPTIWKIWKDHKKGEFSGSNSHRSVEHSDFVPGFDVADVALSQLELSGELISACLTVAGMTSQLAFVAVSWCVDVSGRIPGIQ